MYTGSSEKPTGETVCVSAGLDLFFTVLAAGFCGFMTERCVMLSWENEIVGLPHRNTLLQDGIRSFGLGGVYIGDANSAEYGRAPRDLPWRSIDRFHCNVTSGIKRRGKTRLLQF
ncbi:hypothetical protein [Stenotrophomonas rhizophila]